MPLVSTPMSVNVHSRVMLGVVVVVGGVVEVLVVDKESTARLLALLLLSLVLEDASRSDAPWARLLAFPVGIEDTRFRRMEGSCE